ncbi:HNH endonuclease [Nocardia abscessus]|uniref:HNH endonuclease n=1 Tax=Nocardia abscessus TaxID=120957 RepID=UPI0024569E5C|nr:HNH endonuclease [Nocardia abscessus]
MIATQPRCFRCGLRVEIWNQLDRAHLVDRFLGGLDHEPNLTMLCPLCHKIMPMFEPEQGAEAIAWVAQANFFADFPSLNV